MAQRDYRDTLFLPKTEFPMRAGLAKKEPEILARWAEMDIDKRHDTERAQAPLFVLHDGPPYANGHIHMGTAMNKILKDLVVRSKRAAGFRAPYVPGWDCHGLPIEWKVEENFRAKGRRKSDIPDGEFRAACRTFAEGWIDVQREEFKRLGVTGDWDNPYLTMTYEAEARIVEELMHMARLGLIKRGSKPVMWSPVEETALAEAEVEYHDHVSPTIWVKFPVVEGPDMASVIIWTTTPWTIPANRMIAYGPELSYGLYVVDDLEEDLDFEPWANPGERLVLADALVEQVMRAAKVEDWTRLGDVKPEAVTCRHPLAPLHEGYDYTVPLHAGDFVTDEAGTGFVHCAPGHGADDYVLWRRHNPDAQVPETVGPDGAYFETVALFGGLDIIKREGKKKGEDGPANKAVIDKLVEAGNLLARGRQTHSYPHSWRSKAPLIFRNTPQWFVDLDKRFCLPGEAHDDAKTLRERALGEIDRVAFLPESGRARIRSMVENRPDWLISRQRAWGAPLTLFVHKETGEPLWDPGVDERIAAAIRAGGAEAWLATPDEDLLGSDHDPAAYEKTNDILDVWFDSGSTQAFVLRERGELRWPADLYLEGTDQHRGWFQSSLLLGCVHGRAPYEGVLTHGFVVDGQGRKMSKSLGNSVKPQDLIAKHGADPVRWWVASVDATEDLRFSEETMATAQDSYRKLRNTIRYLLGALDGYNEAEALDVAAMPGLERYILHRLSEVDRDARAALEVFDFKRAAYRLLGFCVSDLSALHLDIRKDALYCDRPESVRRRAARTVMAASLDRLLRLLAPILPFTMEEAWWASPLAKDSDSVHLTTLNPAPDAWSDPDLAARWQDVLKIRRVALGALEIARKEGRIGASLEAHPIVHVSDPALRDAIKGEDLAELFITSAADLSDEPAPADAFTLDEVPGVAVQVGLAQGQKCARSWVISPQVGSDPRYPDLSPRDAEAVAAWDAAKEAEAA